jgi:hypothetical protein
VLVTAVILTAGCIATPTQSPLLPVIINVDGKKMTLDVPPGSSVQQALDLEGIGLDPLDKNLKPKM